MKNVYIYLLIINATGLLCMLIDKINAQKTKFRIPEKVLLGLSLLGGSLGCAIGMYIFSHKTKKPAFTMALPAILVLHLLILWFCFHTRILTI